MSYSSQFFVLSPYKPSSIGSSSSVSLTAVSVPEIYEFSYLNANIMVWCSF